MANVVCSRRRRPRANGVDLAAATDPDENALRFIAVFLYIRLVGPIGPLCHALSLSLLSSWTSMRRRCATVPVATPGEWACGGSQWRMGQTFFKCFLFSMRCDCVLLRHRYIMSSATGKSPKLVQTAPSFKGCRIILHFNMVFKCMKSLLTGSVSFYTYFFIVINS